MENEENEQQQQTNSQQSNSSVSEKVSNIGNTAKNVGKVSDKLAKSEKMQKVASHLGKISKSATKIASTATQLTKIIATVGWIILLIIIVIGLLVFILTGLGFIMNGLKKVGATLLKCFDDAWDGEENTFNEEAIIDVADYLEEMGYDLFGYGFVSKDDAFQFGKPLQLKNDGINTFKILGMSTSLGTYAYDPSCYLSTYVAYTELKADISSKNVKIGPYGDDATNYADFFVSLIKEATSTDKDVKLNSFDEEALKNEIRSKEIKYIEYETNSGKKETDPKSETIEFTGITDNCGNQYKFILKDWYIDIKYTEQREGNLLTEAKLCYNASLTVTGKDESNVDASKKKQLCYDKDDDTYKYLTAYLISDNYAKCIKNSNKNFKQAMSSFGNFFKGIFQDENLWGTGLISIYHDTGMIGEKDKPYGVKLKNVAFSISTLNAYGLFTNAIEQFSSNIEVKNGYLVVNNPGVINDVVFKYKIDGWIGRYGMPLEFLLSTHVATMAPDLSLKLATSFDTDVQILLHEMTIDKVDARITVNGNTVTYDEFDKYNSWADGISNEEAYKILQNTSLESIKDDTSSRYKCTGIPSNTQLSYDNFSSTPVYDVGTKLYTTYDATKELEDDIMNKTLKVQVAQAGNTYKETLYDEFLVAELEKKFKDSNIELTSAEKESIKKEIKRQDIDYIKINEENDKIEGIEKPENATRITGTISRGDGESIEWTVRSVIEYNVSDLKLTLSGKYYYAIDTNVSHTGTSYCSDSGNTTGKVCDSCHAFVNDVRKALYDVRTQRFGGTIKAYTPYINKVSNHWFRNVYFSQAALDSENDKIIENDDEYEQSTGERWTLYEMHDNADNNSREYEMYVYIKDEQTGEYGTEFAKDNSGNYIVCVETEDGEGKYKLSDTESGTYEKDTSGKFKLQVLTENGNNKEYEDYTGELDEFKVGKKAKINSNIEWKGTDKSVYESTNKKTTTDWKTLEITEDFNESNKELFQMEGTKLEYQYDATGTMKQIEDGLRGETNSKIKEIFLDDYYLYDGSKSRALVIQAAKDIIAKKASNLDSDDPDSFEKLGADRRNRK